MRHQKIWTFVVAVMALAGTLAHAEAQMEEPAADRLPVVATTNIVGDIVARVGGDRLSLYVMLPPGADPHAFRPSSRDARQVADAAAVFINGSGLEAGFLGDLIASAEPRLIVDLTAHLNLRRMEDEHEEDEHDEEEGAHGHDHEHGEFDPHVWMDPTLVADWSEEIAEALAGVDPAHGADFAERADALAGELHALDAWVRERVAAIPRDRRILVTDHDVFGYFADRYGFTVLDTIIPGFSTMSEPSARHLAALREAITEYGVPAIFVGLTVSSQTAQVIADDLGIEVVSVYTGSLSEPDGPAATYQDFIRTNVERIVGALAGS
ncbi:MAG: metal ABC transporter substrate-binding protein [Spirochaetaceae bacterium]|nr:metal ABC transporter substrate-binding protein [Spirochaetaceae bacterium]